MEGASWFERLPLWMFFPATVVLVLAVIDVGYRLGRLRRASVADEKEAPVGAMSAAVLGLLAFFLAFTFGYCGARFEERRNALIEEVNAIGTCYLRSQMLPPQIGSDVRKLLRGYVALRVEGAASHTAIGPASRKSEDLHTQLWQQAVKATESDRSAVTALFVSSLNDVIDLHTKRVTYALRGRLPDVIWLALGLITTLSMSVLGYLGGLSGSRRSPAVLAVVLTFATVLTLIADLDRPGEGSLRLGPQMMIDLGRQLESNTT